MSDGDRVLWSEGLFLRPQHFQQQDRHTEALVRGALQAGPLQAWGFRALTLDAALLEAGRVAVTEARGIFPDGTPFAIPETIDPPEPVADRPRHARRRGAAGAAARDARAAPASTPRTPPPPARATAAGSSAVRDAVAGRRRARGDRDRRARPPRCSRPGRDAGGYTTLPVAGLTGLRADGGVALDEGFLPPALATAAVPFYGQLLQEVVTGLDRIAEAHGRMVLGGAGRSVENLLVLELANAARPRLAHMLAQDVYHPSELFLELAGLAGRMATYGSGSRRLSELPAYDHLAPGPAFAALTDTLRSLILSACATSSRSRGRCR